MYLSCHCLKAEGNLSFFDFFVSELSRFYANTEKVDRIGSCEKPLR